MQRFAKVTEKREFHSQSHTLFKINQYGFQISESRLQIGKTSECDFRLVFSVLISFSALQYEMIVERDKIRSVLPIQLLLFEEAYMLCQ